jgi:hypothetical protein
MINNDRIVPITAIDLISIYALILKAGNVVSEVKNPTTTDGHYEITWTTSNGPSAIICTEPVSSVNYTSSAGNIKLYFVAAHDFKGITRNGVPMTGHNGTILPDGKTLWLIEPTGSTDYTVSKYGY